MSDNRNTILYSCGRAFMATLCGMFAFGIGIIFIFAFALALLNAPADYGLLDFESRFAPVIVSSGLGAREVLADDAPVVLKININGQIGTQELNMHTVRRQLIEANEGVLKFRVKGLLLHIDSPGGTVTDADGIYLAIKEFKKLHNIPVYAYVDGLCASGGMYIASAADKIFASDVSLIGSIGVVISPFFNVSELMKKVGVESKTVAAGNQKDEMNPFRTWAPDEDKMLKSIADYYYDRFVNIVVRQRPQIDREKLVEEYGAQVFPAIYAKKIGYIDESGYSLQDAEDSLAKAMQVLTGTYQTVMLEPRVTLTDFLEQGSAMMKSGFTHKLQLHDGMHPNLMNKFLYFYSTRRI